MAAPRKVDYDRIEPSWRAGIKSPAQLAAEYTKDTGVSVSHAAIIKHFKKLGVPRDLSAKVRAKADAMVMESMVTGKVAQITKAREAEIVAEAAGQQAHVHLSQRTDISKARKLAMALFAELEVLTSEPLMIERLEELLDRVSEGDAEDIAKVIARAREALNKAISLPSRANTMKALADTLKTLVTLEREAWGLKANITPDDPAAQFEDIRDSNLRTIEQLSARLTGPAPSPAAAPAEGAVPAEPIAEASP